MIVTRRIKATSTLRYVFALLSVLLVIACTVQEFTFSAEDAAPPDASSDVTSPTQQDGNTTDVDGAAPDALTDTGVQRTTVGLLALYTFMEDSGVVVHDVSGVGTPLNLTVSIGPDGGKAPKQTPDGLVIEKNVLIASNAIAARKVIDAVKLNSAMTVEAWVDPTNEPGISRVVGMATQSTAAASFSLRAEAQSYVVYFDSQVVATAPNSVKNSLTHLVFTRTVGAVATLYIDGVSAATSGMKGTYADWPDADRITIANSVDFSLPWMGTLRLIAFYSRALSAAEVMANFQAH